MTLFDVDKGSVDRGSPDPNRVDQVIEGAVKAHGTTSVSPVTNATTSTDQLATQYGTVRLGQTAYDTGVGFWMGLDTDDVAKLSIGDSGSHSLTWDGSALDIVGSFTATSGSITGGFTIGTGGSLSSGQTAYNTGTGFWLEYNSGAPRFSLGDSSGDNLTWDGSALDITGSLTATSGTIGGWSIGSSSLTSGSGSNSVGLDSGGTNPALYAGSATPGSAPFRVTQAGALTATSATITGSITSTSGAIGGFTIGSTSLTAGSGSTTIGLDSGGTNPAFYAGSATPGSAPFRVTDAGALTATSGTIGGFTIGSSKLYGSTIQTAATVDGTHNGVIMDTSGLRGYSTSLGEVFNIPTDGSAPTFASGTISSTTFNIDTSAVLKTSANALSGSGGDAGVVINNSGFFAGSAGQSTSTANVQLKADGTFKLYSNDSDTITIDHGGSVLLKEGGNLNFTSVSTPGALTATLVATGTGNVDAGNHKYVVTYVNSVGETSYGTESSTVTADSSHKQISLTNIPVSTSASVTARKIYRTKVGDTVTYYLLTTISDNTTTTYTDNTADSSLTGSGATAINNTTAGGIYTDGNLVFRSAGSPGGNWWESNVSGLSGALSLSAAGTASSDIDIELIPKGTGVVRLGASLYEAVTTQDTQTLTNKDLTDATNTFPTFNQDTTGNAATATKLATARTIAGVSFDGTANISITAADVSAIPSSSAPSGTIVGTTDTQTLTNKDLSSSTNTFPDYYPVGTVYYNKTNSANPSTYLPGQSGSTWVALTDVFIVAHGSTYTSTGGAATHTHTPGTMLAMVEAASGKFIINRSATGSWTATNHLAGTQGGDGTAATQGAGVIGTTDSSSNIPPYQAVYAWERTA